MKLMLMRPSPTIVMNRRWHMGALHSQTIQRCLTRTPRAQTRARGLPLRPGLLLLLGMMRRWRTNPSAPAAAAAGPGSIPSSPRSPAAVRRRHPRGWQGGGITLVPCARRCPRAEEEPAQRITRAVGGHPACRGPLRPQHKLLSSRNGSCQQSAEGLRQRLRRRQHQPAMAEKQRGMRHGAPDRMSRLQRRCGHPMQVPWLYGNSRWWRPGPAVRVGRRRHASRSGCR
mmetsp:Transcript_100593/g.285054  ORF Transcript_100593/g.285054 Transcript_100593/m.285054 type:complete len:228 (-) Transcript_100593:213-896(-)